MRRRQKVYSNTSLFFYIFFLHSSSCMLRFRHHDIDWIHAGDDPTGGTDGPIRLHLPKFPLRPDEPRDGRMEGGGAGLRETGGGHHGARGAVADHGDPVVETVEKHAVLPNGGGGLGSSSKNPQNE